MIPIFKPYVPENILDDLGKNIYSGKLSYGEQGKLFEDEVKRYIGNEFFLTSTTYNHALLIVISVLGLQPGDEIIACPVSCLASNQPFAIKGLKIKWVDIDPKTGTICIDDLKRKVTNKTKAIFNNYYCGYLGHAREIAEVGAKYGIPVVDDAIEAFGSENNNKQVGNLFADITVFSFQTVRLPNTIDGGGISFKNKALYNKAKLIRDYGIERANFRDVNNEINPACDILLEGYGALMSEINSIIGLKQMSQVASLIEKQRHNAQTWNSKLQNNSNLNPLEIVNGVNPNFWVYGVRSSDRISDILSFREKGFYATSVHINNNVYSVFNNKEDLVGVNEFMNSFIALPCGWWVEEQDIQNLSW